MLLTPSGTIELLTPSTGEDADPGLSFPLPLTDPEINLGRGQFLDRRGDGFQHLGDVTLQIEGGAACASAGPGAVRAQASGPGGVLKEFGSGGGGGGGGEASTALWQFSRPVALVSRRGAGDGCKAVGVRRVLTARREAAGGGLEMRLEITNQGGAPLKLSALGLSMAFDQNFVGRNLPQVAHQASFVEPFLGGGGGYVQVTRATGLGPVLLLVPLEGSSFEAWRPLRNGEDAMRLDFMCDRPRRAPAPTPPRPPPAASLHPASRALPAPRRPGAALEASARAPPRAPPACRPGTRCRTS